ncbi:MAG: hypothetical protein ACXVCY_00605 [Pseudobdellovibrionaceae bacterium]
MATLKKHTFHFFRQILLLASIAFISPDQALSKSIEKKEDVLKTLNLKEGHYDTILSKSSFGMENFCQYEELDIRLIEDEKKNLTLIIGTILNFPHLETSEFIEKEDKNCELKFINKILPNRFEQKVLSICNKKTVEKEHVIEFKNNDVTYTFIESNKKHICHYSLLLAKGLKK